EEPSEDAPDEERSCAGSDEDLDVLADHSEDEADVIDFPEEEKVHVNRRIQREGGPSKPEGRTIEGSGDAVRR
ncbi:MAG: hypothetical protein II279_02115, partial [Bacteroidaceae bacterium]|nr:hypothetical protein [Bacteroidaceae bacterium]